MQFSSIVIAAFAVLAYASPAEKRSEREVGQVDISLPPGCTKTDLAKCAVHLIGTGGSCGLATIMLGADPAADLACIGAAAGTAANFDECKMCIPKSTNAKQDVKREVREIGQVDVTLPPGCTKKDLGECALHLVATGGSCGAAAIMAGADPVADLACIAAAGSTASNFDECKSCIPKKTNAN